MIRNRTGLERTNLFALTLSIVAVFPAPAADENETLPVAGLREPVELLRDRWGITHIYAENQHDLFFAQGYNVARDRLFQLEMWRRRATGTTAELIGPAGIPRDRATRLLKLRVDMTKELGHYHPDGEEIITAFVEGINAYIALTERETHRLPVEFRLLGFRPQRWTPEVVVSRHNGLSRNVTTEVSLAKAVHAMGPEAVEELLDLHPGNPRLDSPEGLDLSLIDNDVIALYRAHRRAVRFRPEHVVDAASRPVQASARRQLTQSPEDEAELREALGSNNWVLMGRKTATGYPIMANDPHRQQQVPSLRYWVHLVAPGWNVIGGGEPALPGVSIGHNEYGAWGLTIFAVDQEDLYVYDTHPDDPNQYRYKGRWETMEVKSETIPVKGQAAAIFDLKYTRHGPVIHEDPEHHKAYALRAVWHEVGTAPYLASLRLNQAKTWEEFREGCRYHNVPSENMIWAGVDSNIGWQAVGMTPIRKGWNGLLPVPGDGRFEWSGYLPIQKLPHVSNPASGFFASANEDNVPRGYPHALGHMWSAPYRSLRLHEVLDTGRRFNLVDTMRLQVDEVSLAARELVPLLKDLTASAGSGVGHGQVVRLGGTRSLASADEEDLVPPQTLTADESLTEGARQALLAWNFTLDKDSFEAAIHTVWQAKLVSGVKALYVPEEHRSIAPGPPLTNVIRWLVAPDGHFGHDPTAGRDAFLLDRLTEAIRELKDTLGEDMAQWRYGQAKFHHIALRHTLSPAVNDALQAKLDLGPLPRGGNATTVNNTSGRMNQGSGASFKIIADTSDWDRSLGANNPGQSGDPDSPHYSDLFNMWADGKYFPIFYTREKIESVMESKVTLTPGN